MLDLGSYLLGVLQILLLAGFAGLGGSSVRVRLVPKLSGTPAFLASCVLALAILVWVAELLGSFNSFEPLPYLLLVGAVGAGCWALLRRVAEDGASPSRPSWPWQLRRQRS